MPVAASSKRLIYQPGILSLVMMILMSVDTHIASAQSPTDSLAVCNAALAKDIGTIVRTQEQDLDFISIVDQHTFEEAKAKGSFGATIPYAEALLKLSGDWEAFKKNRTDYFQMIGYQARYKEGEFQHFEITSPLAYPAWSHCIEVVAASSSDGLYVWKVEEDENAVVITIYYKVPEDSIPQAKKVRLEGTVKYGDSAPSILFNTSQTIATEQRISKIISRQKVSGVPQKVYVSLNAGKKSISVFSDWKPEPPPPTSKPETRHLNTDFSKGLFTGFRFVGKSGHRNLVGADLSVSGPITSVVYKGASGEGSDHIWYVPDQNIYSADRRSVFAVVVTDHGPPNEPTVFFTVNYDVSVDICIGRDNKPHGLGCPVRSPLEVLAGGDKQLVAEPIF